MLPVQGWREAMASVRDRYVHEDTKSAARSHRQCNLMHSCTGRNGLVMPGPRKDKLLLDWREKV